jgi:hypothetical protein
MSQQTKGATMRRVALFALVAVLCATSVALAPPSSASTKQAVTINSQIDLNVVPFPTGTWTATGGIADTGTLVEAVPIFVGNGQLHIERVLTGEQGTITVRIQSTVTGVVGDTATFTGYWVVVSGTGAYADLHGHGLRTATVDLNTSIATETLTGDVHFD